MTQYDPGSETQGTCPYCERRVKVGVPRGGDGSARVCCRHKLPPRLAVGEADPTCPGSRMICTEDRRPGLDRPLAD